MPANVLDDFRRYEQLIQSAMGEPPASREFTATAETHEIVQVERGVIFADAVRAAPIVGAVSIASSPVERLIEVAPRVQRIVVVDRAGHHRPIYKPVLVYAWLQAYRIWYETLSRAEFGRWEEASRAWCDALESDLGDVLNATTSSAANGARVATNAWAALALHVAGKLFIRDAWTDLAADAMGKIARAQQERGPYLAATSSDNPETHWYHELVILHALSSFAVQAEDRGIAASVRRATAFHQNETEPNHATDAPWGLFAFVWNSETRSVADQLLSAAQARSNDLSLMLLADALYCVRLFTNTATSA